MGHSGSPVAHLAPQLVFHTPILNMERCKLLTIDYRVEKIYRTYYIAEQLVVGMNFKSGGHNNLLVQLTAYYWVASAAGGATA
jgi:hypothetical protein